MNEISNKIGSWYDLNKRDLPWRRTQNPYFIWLSETILQQTRVVQGWDYYLRFTEQYPTVQDLAAAKEDDVLKLWQGLGYYSRARNLHAAAIQIVSGSWYNEKGEPISFPTKYSDLIKLKGIGPYTAAAIASFSSNEKVAVVDGNVYRVLSRVFDLETPIDSGKGQKEFMELATELLPDKKDGTTPGHHNQAMMEFGALHCTPTSPKCKDCTIAEKCLALANGTVMNRPVKTGKIKIKQRHFDYIIYIYKDCIWVHQRGAGDIWQGLWEPYLIESKDTISEMTNGEKTWSAIIPSAPLFNETVPQLILQRKHQLTHQTIYADFWVCKVSNDKQEKKLNETMRLNGYSKVNWIEWQNLAVPRLIDEVNQLLSSSWF